MFRTIVSTLILVAMASTTHAQSVCKGLEQPACEAMVFESVPVCRWQGEYFTTAGKRGNYCTTSNKKIQDADQFSRLQAALPGLRDNAINGTSN